MSHIHMVCGIIFIYLFALETMYYVEKPSCVILYLSRIKFKALGLFYLSGYNKPRQLNLHNLDDMLPFFLKKKKRSL